MQMSAPILLIFWIYAVLLDGVLLWYTFRSSELWIVPVESYQEAVYNI